MGKRCQMCCTSTATKALRRLWPALLTPPTKSEGNFICSCAPCTACQLALLMMYQDKA